MNIGREWDEGGQHNYEKVMVNVPVFIRSIVHECLLDIYKKVNNK